MKLKFRIKYATSWGERLCVVLNCCSKDGTVRQHHLEMKTDDGEWWLLETSVLESRQHPLSHIVYAYHVEDSKGCVQRREWNLVARCYHFDTAKDYEFCDQWRDRPLLYHLYTDACAVTRHEPLCQEVEARVFPLYRKTLMFRVSAPQLRLGQSVALCGSHPSMGSWNPSRFLRMEYVGQHEWMLTINAVGMFLPLEYKYIVVDDATNSIVSWEEGDNRQVEQTELVDGQVYVMYGEQLRLPEKLWRAAGVAIPVAALRSEHSYGVGDFGDLKHFMDWVARTGMNVVQLLPIFDTTTNHHAPDACPYKPISGFALHPHYIDLDAAGTLRSKTAMTQFMRRRQELNAQATVDYEAVDCVKTDYLRQLFAEQGKRTLSTASCQAFVASASEWLKPYADYRGEPYDYVCYVQYLLHSQLKAAADYGRAKGVVLKGDLPLGMHRESVDVRQYPELFRLDGQMGVSPDHSTTKGQNWQSPTYQWTTDGDSRQHHIEEWLQKRLRHLTQYFGAIKLDHIVGYFCQWELPDDAVDARLGHYISSLPLTVDEIEYFGLHFRHDLFTRPFINDHIIGQTFGIHADYVREHYLNALAYQLYELKPEFNTQRKVVQAFCGRNDENSLWIRDGLLRLIANVLFVEDHDQKEMYHPRMQAVEEPVFDALNADEKEAYLRLYYNYFRQRHSFYWGQLATRRLAELSDHCRMLVCGDDLGQQPESVSSVLDTLRFLSLEVQQMPKQHGLEFAHLEANPYRSVATISTPDMAPLRLWWQDNPERRQRYYITMLQKEGRAPEQLPAFLAEEIIARHLYCPSMLCILQLQDWLAMDGELRRSRPQDERINTLSDPSHCWNYRMHITIDQLLQADRLNDKILTMVKRSHRYNPE